MNEPLNGGLVTARHATTLQPGELSRADNIVYNKNDDSVHSREPIAQTTTHLGTGESCTGLRTINFRSGEQFIVALGTTANNLYAQRTGVAWGTALTAVANSDAGLCLSTVPFNDDWIILTGGHGLVSYEPTSAGDSLKLIPHGMLPVTSPPTATTANTGKTAGVPTTGANSWYEYWVTEVFRYSEDGSDVDVESTFEGSPANVNVTSVSAVPQLTIPRPINQHATHFNIYRAGPKGSSLIVEFPTGFRVDTVAIPTSGNVVWYDQSGNATDAKTPASHIPAAGATSAGWYRGYDQWTNTTSAHDGTTATCATVTPLYTGTGPYAVQSNVRSAIFYNSSFTAPAGRITGVTVTVNCGVTIPANVTLFATLAVIDKTQVHSANQVKFLTTVGGPFNGLYPYAFTTFTSGVNQVVYTSTQKQYDFGRAFPQVPSSAAPAVVSTGGSNDMWGLDDGTLTPYVTEDGETAAGLGVIITAVFNSAADTDEDGWTTAEVTNTLYVREVSVTLNYSTANEELEAFPLVIIDDIGVGRNGRPPRSSVGTVFEGSVLLDDVDAQGNIVYSSPGFLHYFPAPYRIDVSEHDNSTVMALATINNKAICLTQNARYRINYLPNEDDSAFQTGRCYEQISPIHGAVNRNAWTVFTGPDGRQRLASICFDGIFATDGFSDDEIGMDLSWSTISSTIGDLPTNVIGLYNDIYNQRLLFAYITSGGTPQYYALHYHVSHIKNRGQLKVTGPCDFNDAKTSGVGVLAARSLLIYRETTGQRVFVVGTSAGYLATTSAVSGTGDTAPIIGTRVIFPENVATEEYLHNVGLINPGQMGYSYTITGYKTNRTSAINTSGTMSSGTIFPEVAPHCGGESFQIVLTGSTSGRAVTSGTETALAILTTESEGTRDA